MGTSSFNITMLPLELFRAILVEAMHARGMKRAMRLRLVNTFFAVEVMRTLRDTRFLEYREILIPISKLGRVGPDFMAHRLLHTNYPVCSRWNSIRIIARRLAAEGENEDEEESYARYTMLLCHRAASQTVRPDFIKDLCDVDYGCGGYTNRCFEYDLICAAAYTNKLATIDELGNSRNNLRVDLGTFGSLYMNGVDGNNHAAVDLLFAKRVQIGQNPGGTQANLLSNVTWTGADVFMVRKFLPSAWTQDFLKTADRVITKIESAMSTPSVEVFEVLLNLKQMSCRPEIDAFDLATWLHCACENGWEEMASHLIDVMEAPVNKLEDALDEDFVHQALPLACLGGSAFIVRLLMKHNATMPDNTLGEAAGNGHWHLVWILVDEYGADLNAGDTPLIVWAVKQERKDIILDLLHRGAKLEEYIAIKAVNAAQEDGLESMLEILEACGVHSAETLRKSEK